MEIKSVIDVKTEVTTDIICDSCGESWKIFIDDNKTLYYYDIMELKSDFNYSSNKDGQEWTAQICEKCVDEKLSFINFHKKIYD